MMSFLRSSLPVSAALVALVLTACTTPPPSQPVVPAQPVRPAELLKPVPYSALPDWERDDLREAWPAFMASCDVLAKKLEWSEPCSVARSVNAADGNAVRTFFEAFLTPFQLQNADGTDSGLVTGYYEPLLHGARRRGGRYQTPLHGVPGDMLTIDLAGLYPELKGMRLRGRLAGNKVVPYFSRAELAQGDRLAGRELLWVDDPVDAFFLQVQGSGRVQLTETGETVRLAYADQNGHPYRSIGRYLVDKGEMTLDQASAQNIKAWIAANPARRQEVLNANPGYVFFREEKVGDPSKGPKGALGVPLTAQRSIAVDPQYVPLGVPVFLATTQPASELPLRRLMMAQDTGGAIRNPVRADYFWGFGPEAGERAGKMKQRGAMWILLPKSPPR